jgi:peptidoglycan/xylan/chitin deacetylase (PgdA/CDA1 family)
MMAGALLKRAISSSAHRTGLSRVLATRYRGRGVIFFLHSVVDDVSSYPDDSLRCSVSGLARALQWLKNAGFEFLGLDEAVERLISGRTNPFAVFTFDDGYADNLTHALPVMQRFEAPFTVYTTTGMLTREIDAWWFGLADLVRRQSRLELRSLGRKFDCSTIEGKKHTFRAIEAAIHNDFEVLAHVKAAINEQRIDCSSLVDREALTLPQLRRLAQHPLVTIGGHTTTHRNLAQASPATVERELTENRKFLQDITGRPVQHFAYPFGHPRACGIREAEISRNVGFRTAATTRLGTLHLEHAHRLHALPRIRLDCGETSSTLRCKIDGVYQALQSRWGDPVVHM